MSICEHKWVWKESVRHKECDTYGSRTYKKTDIYFCEKCLQEEIKIKNAFKGRFEEGVPDWY